MNAETHLFLADLHRGSNNEATLVGVEGGVQAWEALSLTCGWGLKENLRPEKVSLTIMRRGMS